MPFNADALLPFVQALRTQRPACNKLLIGYSGGLDSHVLLHAIQHLDLPFSVRAIHINHGLNPAAASWQAHCQSICSALYIPLQAVQVSVPLDDGKSLEAKAREARYKAFAEALHADECLLLAHHQDDQAETLLQRLLRGAGPKGMAAMPLTRSLGTGLLWRPLLEQSRDDLHNYALTNSLRWINDESNSNTRFDRNFLRQIIFPKIAERWPGYRQSLTRSAQLSHEASQLLNELAAIDLALACTEDATQLNAVALQQLSAERQRNLLRFWLASLGFAEPGWHILHRCVSELLPAAPDAEPELIWEAHELRRFRDRLYAVHTPGELQTNLPLQIDRRILAAAEQFDLTNNGALVITAADKGGLLVPQQGRLEVLYRQGGEKCKLQGRRTRSLKKILHDAAIPPWLRDRQPLVCLDGKIICIPGVGVCEDYAAKEAGQGLKLVWRHAL